MLLGFGPIQRDVGVRDVGVLEQRRLGVPVVRHECQPDAHSHHNLVAVHREWLLDRGDDPLGEQLDILRPGNAGLDDGKLVAAQPSHRVALAHTGQQPLRHRHQQAVAHRMSQRVVHPLELVQVQAEHRRLPVPQGPHSRAAAACLGIIERDGRLLGGEGRKQRHEPPGLDVGRRDVAGDAGQPTPVAAKAASASPSSVTITPAGAISTRCPSR